MSNKPLINVDWREVLRIVMVIGIVYLMLHGKDGWGWLIFALILTY
jgi:hypothetical protein